MLGEDSGVPVSPDYGSRGNAFNGRVKGAAQPARAVLPAMNHKTVKVKVAPIECYLEQVVQHDDAGQSDNCHRPRLAQGGFLRDSAYSA